VSAGLAFLAGVAVMATELTASRRLAPLFGFTLATWSVLISVTLLAGALGAALGGWMSGRGPSLRAAGVCHAGAGLWMAGVGFLFGPLGRALLDVALLPGLAVATTLLVGPPVLLASAVFPILVELRAPERRAGPIAGKLVAVSTLGSLAGTLATGLWLIPELGVQVTAFLVGGLVAAAGVATWFAASRARAAVSLWLVAIGGGALILPGPRETEGRVVRETPYGLLELDHSPLHVSLRVNGINQSTYSPESLRCGTLLRGRKYLELLPYLRPDGRRVLDIGLGAGLVARSLALHGLDVTSVEVNAPLAALVRDRLGYEGVVHVEDGRRFLNTCAAVFDHVILDVFHGESLPAHLMTREAFRSAKDRLSANGVLAIHLIGAPETPGTASVVRTLRTVFSEILCVRSGIGNELQDLYLFASDARLEVPPEPALARAGWLGNEIFDPPVKDAELLTDDRNPIEILNRPAARALRRRSRPPR